MGSLSQKLKKLFSGTIRMGTINIVIVALVIILSLLLLKTAQDTTSAHNALIESTQSYISCERAANDLYTSSTYLTTQVRMFAITHDQRYMDRFFNETLNLRTREKAVDTLRHYLTEETEAYTALETALGYSDTLVVVENYCIKLVCDAENIPYGAYAPVLDAITLSAEDAALSGEEKLQKSEWLVTEESYQNYKDLISENVQRCKALLSGENARIQAESTESLARLLTRQKLLITLVLTLVILSILATMFLILIPLRRDTVLVKAQMPLELTGSAEIAILAHAYNEMYEENRKHNDHLKHAAEHDALTGLYNRGAHERFLEEFTHDVAFMIVDIDYFKQFNDKYGHDMGDAVLKKVSMYLSRSFRSTDYPCRFGGDEFSVFITGVNPSLRSVIVSKIEAVRKGLADTSDGLPPVTLSIGVAFSEGPRSGDLFKDADTALYKVKERGRNGYAFFGDD